MHEEGPRFGSVLSSLRLLVSMKQGLVSTSGLGSQFSRPATRSQRSSSARRARRPPPSRAAASAAGCRIDPAHRARWRRPTSRASAPPATRSRCAMCRRRPRTPSSASTASAATAPGGTRSTTSSRSSSAARTRSATCSQRREPKARLPREGPAREPAARACLRGAAENPRRAESDRPQLGERRSLRAAWLTPRVVAPLETFSLSRRQLLRGPNALRPRDGHIFRACTPPRKPPTDVHDRPRSCRAHRATHVVSRSQAW